MTISLLNIGEEEIVLGDKFSTIEIDCEDNIFLKRSGSQLNPCQGASSFSLQPGTLNRSVPAGCYDGTERINISDSALIPSNIRVGKTIFQVSGSYAGLQYPTGQDITLLNGILTGLVPHGAYSGKTVSIYDTDLLSSNIKSGQSILGTVGIYRGTTPDSNMIPRGYHAGCSHGSAGANANFILTRCFYMAGKIFALYVSDYSTGSTAYNTTLISYDGSIINILYSDGENFPDSKIRENPTPNHFYLYVGGTIKYDFNATNGTYTYIGSVTPTEAEITSTSATMNGLLYEPILVATRMWGSGGEIYMGASCNFKINRI